MTIINNIECPFNEPLHNHHDGCPSCNNPTSLTVEDLLSFDALSAKIKQFSEMRKSIILEAGLDTDFETLSEESIANAYDPEPFSDPNDGSWEGR
jgi:hypothetical protein